jgi:CspA family cold shock protein
MNGIVKKKTDRGFGFIKADGMDKDLFFHSKALVGVTWDELQEGDAVTFETEESPKGMNAVNVQKA